MHRHDPIAIAKNLSAFEFRELAPFNGAAFCMYYGDRMVRSDWEMHPDTDELLLVLKGRVTVEILTDSDRYRLALTAGQFVIVPTGHWHRHVHVHDVIEVFFTPGTTVESTADDPRLCRVPSPSGPAGKEWV
ncbi:cupin domain-containing protein [Mycolicibacillus parakoreensis]|uniref:Cupin domain-containing protein n=1 Tax=Mycolicibacillus parakoreensis TaxID=1069221 RepID=A0ABY3U3V1_9MYCO|nr:cupin domain-containing protein [Mycolicibacillus parakoreensis]MCV7315264.1 cupin domain-containing protein [Mycolicibacillus parakoreensis]ULN53406.1 cupin domain-containing protein [Mycolicibacillus parakoreensis]